jgi:hypothetical protein
MLIRLLYEAIDKIKVINNFLSKELLDDDNLDIMIGKIGQAV